MAANLEADKPDEEAGNACRKDVRRGGGAGADFPLAFDVTRLFLSPLSLSPRGIDRIDLMLARHFFLTERSNVWGVLPTPWGVRLYSADRVVRGLEHIQHLWAETDTGAKDPAFEWLRNAIGGVDTEKPAAAREIGLLTKALRMFAMLRATGFSFGTSARRALPAGSAYLNIGQFSLAIRPFLSWLERRKDVNAVIMVHDAIPVERPDLVAPSSTRLHRAMLDNAERYANGLIVSTEAAKTEIERHRRSTDAPAVPTLIQSLPISAEFETPASRDPILEACDYFVVCGAIEKRKNLGLLLEAWRKLAADLGPDTPHLAIVGAPHHGAAEIIAAFETCASTCRYTHVAHGVSTRSLKTLMAHARGLLMPSLAEGFGLPLVEARALGCPVIASDIPAHREVLGRHGKLLPTDAPSLWADEIKATRRPATQSRHPVEQLAGARAQFIAGITRFLADTNAQSPTAIADISR